jgi:DnaK suppressor protein
MDEERARQLLAEERARLERSLSKLGYIDDAEEHDEFDPQSLGADLYQDEYNEGLAGDLREQLAAVARAEERLANGTYGLSVASGKPIPDARLEAVPTAELTVEEERAAS